MKLFNFTFGSILILFLIAISGCKKDSGANAVFVGKYSGSLTEIDYFSPPPSDTISLGADTVTITAGANSNQIIIIDKGTGVTLTGTVVGNNITIQTAGNLNTATYSGNGNINGSSLILDIIENDNSSVANGYPYLSKYIFSGNK